jgi:hypothetical protein
MWMYLGSGRALAAAMRGKRVRVLADCVCACDEAMRQLRQDLASDTDERASRAVALAAAADCHDACGTAAELMARGSRLVEQAAGVCATASRDCAAACAAVSPNEVIAACHDACRRAEEACRELHEPGAA